MQLALDRSLVGGGRWGECLIRFHCEFTRAHFDHGFYGFHGLCILHSLRGFHWGCWGNRAKH
jgi:hypothetical protein